VLNQGSLGVGKTATVNFKGRSWENDATALITDETNNGTGTAGEGGWIRFSDTALQLVTGGYNAATRAGPSFPKLAINNERGLSLTGGSTRVRNGIDFQKGHIYLQDQLLSVGNNNPGTITGYDSSKYFVTGNAPDKGLLIREDIRSTDGLIVFPVGSKAHAYTPAALQNRGTGTNSYYVTVFDSVRTDGSTGTAILNSGVNKTWQIGAVQTSLPEETEIVLQHLNEEEGTLFSANKLNAYISRWINGDWDTSYPQNMPGPGYLTTGPVLNNSGVNARTLTAGTSVYVTKFTGNGAGAPVTKLWFDALRRDTGRVRVYWKTNPEINTRAFVIERRLANETGFTPLDTVSSLALNGYSNRDLLYDEMDPNNYRGISFYRLRVLLYNNSFYFSDTVAVPGFRTPYRIVVWPNPSPGAFNVAIPKILNAKTVVIWDAIGQLIRQEAINDRTVVPLYIPIQGAYFIGIVLSNGTIIETKKVMITGSR